MPYPYTSQYDLGTLGGILSFGRGINDSDQVVGDAYLPDSSTHAFLCSGANCTMTDLGTLAGDAGSSALAINNSGQVVGYSQGGFVQRGFLYTSGAMVDLNSLLPSDSGWSITQGTAINDSGQITGLGAHNGVGHAFLMSPPPYVADIQQPINADGSSVFSAKHGVEGRVPARWFCQPPTR